MADAIIQRIHTPIIRAERREPGFRESIHFRSRVMELSQAYVERRANKSGRHSIDPKRTAAMGSNRPKAVAGERLSPRNCHTSLSVPFYLQRP